METRDAFSRPMKDLRISVTDRCNFRCVYCMPLNEYAWVERQELLTFEEIERLARVFLSLGVEKIRLTGGEPLVRKDIEILVGKLARLEGVRDLCLTTNGALLAEIAPALKAAGLRRLNISLDTLQPENFRKITQRGDLEKVLEGLRAAQQLGFAPIKINAVIERGVNDDEIVDLVEFSRANHFPIRLIEYMDVGNSNQWKMDKVFSKKEILEAVSARYPFESIGRKDASAPADSFRFLDGKGEMGVIASVTEPFCADCTRARLTADGKFVTCLFSEVGHDLKGAMRRGASDDELRAKIADVWSLRTDRFSEDRFHAMKSPEGYKPAGHRKIEMIVLGG